MLLTNISITLITMHNLFKKFIYFYNRHAKIIVAIWGFITIYVYSNILFAVTMFIILIIPIIIKDVYYKN